MQLQRLGPHGRGHMERPTARAPGLSGPARAPVLPHIQQPARRGSCIRAAAAQKLADLPPSLKKIVGTFQLVPDPMARYKQLLFYATKLQKMPAELQTPANKVEGCVSQVWVVPELRADGKVYWQADSDSQLTKGLAALLVNGLSGCTPQEIISVQPDFIEMLGLKQSLTPSRNNGFLNMLRLMQRRALEVAASAQAASNGSSSPADVASEGPRTQPASASRTPVQDAMRRKLQEALQPVRMMIEDQSAQHAGHAGVMASPGKGSASGETHFRVALVSAAFEGKTLVQRQRMVYQLLSEEFGAGLHALSLDTKAPGEDASLGDQ